ncbi:PREDICTED: probable xyloglucan endotransglucosylase/hydrolase protein 28 [Tarenaya hassleriana]|uniref:probable xyloglucan endotransglucosylase/hydrolase protein 28 n=1 Tax=Tarenaya hassleriana TaxID=28532 RepID=UPI00053C7B41|nr:PREDICTED: probable xyloglucan endotransglucosylase/hydrolase protein 28 [Tarenaya hassleriana]
MDLLGSVLVFMVLFAGLVSGFALETLPVISFEEGYSHLFGDQNLAVRKDGKSVRLSLDERTGSGFVSNDLYLHGFFSAKIKLPADYTAGVVVAFYMSNGDMYEKNHDEIDFEFLGNIRGKEWRIQTNIYGNGSTHLGREERCYLWFDPTEDFHQYSILWSDSHIIFYIDNVPIREVKRTASMGGDFPSKPMSLYSTIWDGSKWATNGGKYGVNYKYAPFVARFSDFVLHGCAVDPIEQLPKCDFSGEELRRAAELTSSQRITMEDFRRKHMTYSYCYDQTRYKVVLPECVLNPAEAKRLRVYDPVTFGGIPHRHGKNRRRRRRAVVGSEAM